MSNESGYFAPLPNSLEREISSLKDRISQLESEKLFLQGKVRELSKMCENGHVAFRKLKEELELSNNTANLLTNLQDKYDRLYHDYFGVKDEKAELQLVNLRLKHHAEAMAKIFENSYYQGSPTIPTYEEYRKDFPK